MAKETIRKGPLGPQGILSSIEGSQEGLILDGKTPLLLYFEMETPLNGREFSSFILDYGLVQGRWTICQLYGDPALYLKEIRREIARRFSDAEFVLEAYRLKVGQHI